MPVQGIQAAQALPARTKSTRLFSRAMPVFPGGVTRATVEKDPIPFYVAYGEGAYLVDVDGNRLLDLNNNFTTLIHGHGFEPVRQAASDLMRMGTCFANPTQHEIGLAELLVDRIPAIEQVRFVNSGTEAVMFAIKAARAFTGRPGIVRIEGAYHGAYDWAEAGQAVDPNLSDRAAIPRAIPAYHGTPASVADDVHLIRFNDVDGLEQRLDALRGRVACVLIDPMPSRAGLIHPTATFVETLSSVARKHGILIIADEVLNLRQGYAGASPRYGLTPDLVTAGKIIGGGFPIGAVGGREEVMRVFGTQVNKPLLPQGGTFSANPVSMVAGRVAMEAMTHENFNHLEALGERVRVGLESSISRTDAPFCVTGASSLFRIHPKRLAPTEYREALQNDAQDRVMKELARHLLQWGILLPHGAAASLSTPMTNSDIDLIVAAFDDFLNVHAANGRAQQ